MERFRLEKSQLTEGWWVLTDTVNLVVITFEEGRFNETQKITQIEGGENYTSMNDVMAQVRIIREMSDWFAINHYKIAMR
jgi:hypothetical protein